MPKPGQIIRDLTGMRFGRLVITGFNHRTHHRRSMWTCLCDCGRSTIAETGNLTSGNTTSCGCYRSEFVSYWATDHGHNRPKHRSPEYHSWSSMWARVNATSGQRFEHYGSRGITVCDRWKSFACFLEDVGHRPKGTSLDRIDNNGNYEPGNCRWATPSVQNANQRRSRKYTCGVKEAC